MLIFCCNRCILTEVGTDKNHPGQNLPDKRLPGQKLPRAIEREFVQLTFVRVFVLGLLKIWGCRDV